MDTVLLELKLWGFWGAAPIDTVTLVTVSILLTLVDISLVLVLVTIPLSMYRTPDNPSSVNFDLN